ncbi:ankyrin repeat protein [Rhizobium azibense]|uniref:Ankyrin repeat protein n=1 Tax=Rhizobium azibense TaxID=1136135 RepID=A0A4R3QL84_9HYPH|nr:ankyrin repeat domain-containing protein [Rhizobium azibense]TCU21829.1 ankyrin repeat protein [Rhizobium azibense]
MVDKSDALHAEFLEAAGRGDLAKLRVYIDNPAIDINYAEPRQGLTALHIAAARNAVAAVRLLMGTGRCNAAIKDHDGRTAARLAVILADNPVVGRYLFDQEHSTLPEKTAKGAGQASQRRAES